MLSRNLQDFVKSKQYHSQEVIKFWVVIRTDLPVWVTVLQHDYITPSKSRPNCLSTSSTIY